MNHHTYKQILNYNLDLDVLGCKSFSFIANPIFPAIFNFPWKKAYKIETEQIETIRKIMSPHALNICLNAQICACVFRCVSFQFKEKNVQLITCCGFNFPDMSCTRSASFIVIVTSPLATIRNTSVFSLLIYLRLYNPFFVSVKSTDEMVHKVGQNWVLPTHVPGPLFRRYFPATINPFPPALGNIDKCILHEFYNHRVQRCRFSF